MGRQRRRRQREDGHDHLRPVHSHAAVRELPGVGRGLHQHAGGARALARQQGDLQHLRRRAGGAPAGRGRSAGVRRPQRRHPRRRRRDRRADGGLHQGKPVGAHQRQRLPPARITAVLRERADRRRLHHAAADGSRQVRRAVGRRGGEGNAGPARLQGHARRSRARRRPADRLHPRRPRPALGRRGAHLPAARAGRHGTRSHPHLRRHERRRYPRPPQGVHREPEPRERPSNWASAASGSAPPPTCCSSR